MSPARVHPTAEVEPGVVLGDDVAVWHHVHVRTGASIGSQTLLGKDVFVDEGVVVGARCKIQNGAQLYRGTVIGDGVFVGPRAVLANDRHPRAVTPSGELKSPDDWTIRPNRIGEGASIGAGAVVVGAEVGPWALVGAGAVVVHDVPSHGLALGVPAVVVGEVCFCARPAVPRSPDCGWAPSA
ncbi:MAG: acyltransferase [Actinomycetota bacterium]